MSTGILLIIGVLVIGLILFLVINKKTHKKNYHSNGIPIGMEKEYDILINPGQDGKPVLYDLTTCNHCVRVHEFLMKHKIEHHDISVDLFEGEARRNIVEKIKTYNPRISFPTLVMPDGKVVIGYREKLLMETLGLEE